MQVPILPAEFPNVTIENLFAYTPVQHDIVSHVLTLGYAAMAAGLVFFLATMKNSAPRYRMSSVLSAVVMISALLELYRQWQVWNETFVWTGAAYALDASLNGGNTFSNGYRYMNWSIDVPVLLTQLLIILGIKNPQFKKYWVQFVVAGLLMIYTGYIGQFYQVTDHTLFYIWGTISTVFFVWLLVVVRRVIFGHMDQLPPETHGMMRGVWWLLVVSWMLYPGAYLMPVLWPTADGVVAKQIIFTIADVTSKVIYGVMLTLIATKISQLTGYEPAQRQEIA